jgi:1,2-diacylglycerol 3-alpha-glucosyltransferase
VVGTNHFLPENLSENFRIPDQWRDMVGRLLWRNMLAVYNQLVAVTTPTQTGVAILRQQSLQVPVQAISCGVDTVRFRLRPDLDRDEVRRKYGLALDKNIFLYLGRVDREKRVEVVVNAMANLQVEQVQFVVAGKGRYLADVQHLCRSLGLGQRVICVGFVPEEDLPLLLNSVDAFVMPSQAELQSISTLEAMSSGLPVLAANARALPELVTDGVNGYLMAPGDVADTRRGILTMLSNRFRWAEMGATSRAKALVHAHENSVQRYSDWYKQVILQRIPTSVALQVSRQEV